MAYTMEQGVAGAGGGQEERGGQTSEKKSSIGIEKPRTARISTRVTLSAVAKK